VARNVTAAVRCRYSPAVPAAPRIAASGPAPPAPIANSACCPAALARDGTRPPARPFSAIAAAAYPAVHAADTSSSYSQVRIAIGLWLTVAASWLAAVPLAALALAVPLTWQAGGTASGARAGPAAVAGILLAIAVIVRASWHLARAHAAFLPHGRHRVVITTSALPRLSPGQLRAVLAEMTADDHAARRHGAADLAAALVTLAGAGSRGTALAAGGPAAIAGQGCTAGRRHRGIPHPSRDRQPPASHRCMRHHLHGPVTQQETAPEAVSLALLRACEGTVACKATSVTEPAALTG